jgi:hypothetical protein
LIVLHVLCPVFFILSKQAIELALVNLKAHKIVFLLSSQQSTKIFIATDVLFYLLADHLKRVVCPLHFRINLCFELRLRYLQLARLNY